MKRFLLLFICLSILVGGGCTMLPSVCDNNTEPSVLCDVAADADVRIEDVGNLLIVINIVAIEKEAYTAEDAVSILKEIRMLLVSPMTYLVFKSELNGILSSYPGLMKSSELFISNFDSPDYIYPKDKEILTTWLDNRISELAE